MTIKAIFFDFGGVILRTEYQAPRQALAERFNMEYEDIDKAVFNSPSAKQASLGQIAEEAHWREIGKRFRLSDTELKEFEKTFFAGDVIDRDFLEYIEALKPKYHVGLISNAWSELRAYMTKEKIIHVFDSVTISAEVGAAKPSAQIYQIALEQANVKPEEAAFVDDFQVNIEACESLGMRGILFKSPQDVLKRLYEVLK
ncbi:MAG: HAD family phosphatase [Anaerolineales bacterium]|nr:HAD family phosphatase [Anaerolineales bacterium]